MNEIPIFDSPKYKFSVVIEGKSYLLDFMYNTRADYWAVSMFDGNTKDPIATSVPMVVVDGMFDQYLDAARGLMPIDLAEGADPNIDNIATSVMAVVE